MKTEAKIIHKLGGMPRAGSTLLMNILAQNPAIHATATSGMMDVCFGVRNAWDSLIEHKSNTELAKKRFPQVINGIMQSYYQDVEESIVVDKSRGWTSLIEMFEHVTGEQLKIVVPVRDIRDILASFEKLWRKTSETHQLAGEAQNYIQFQTTEGRAEYWLRYDQAVGLAYSRITDAVNRGLKDRMLFIDYDLLCQNPAGQLRLIYEFWGMEQFEHNFEHVEQVTWEDDSVHGMDLHGIRPKVEPQSGSWRDVLGSVGEKYNHLARFWEE